MRHLYCIEGHWGYDWGEPSVEPMLDMVRSMGGWPYIRRNSATVGEMQYWLRTEWCSLDPGSILYIASHGWPSQIWLANEDESREVETLDGLVARAGEGFADRCLVHFGGCRVLQDVSDDSLDAFLKHSHASAVSGYTEDAGWLTEPQDGPEIIPPSVALEAMLFSSIMNSGVDEGGLRLDLLQGDRQKPASRRKELRGLEEKLDGRFPECGFRLRTRSWPLAPVGAQC